MTSSTICGPKCSRSLSRLDGARQDQLNTGQVVSRAISDLNMVQGLLGMVPMLLGSAVLFVLSIVIMAFLSPLLTVVALAVAPALWCIAVASRRRLFPASWDAQQQAASVAGVVDGAVTGVRVVKGFGQEEQENDRLADASTWLYASRVRAVRLMARYNPALQAVPLFGQVGVLALGGWLAIRGSIPLGTFLAFSLYVAQLVGPVRALTSLVTIGQEARASVIRIFEVIDSRPVITERPGAVPLPPGAADVELDEVRFGYCPPSPCCAACRCGSGRVRHSPWSAPRAPASRRSRCCSPASTTSAAARSGSAAAMSGN